MRLRANLRRPGRYREKDVEDLPPNPMKVEPTIPFNPNLRPACFPTLAWNELSPDHPAFVAPEETPSEQEVPESKEGEEVLVRKAICFRDNRIVPIMEAVPGLTKLSDGTWVATEDEGEFDEFAGIWDDDDDNTSGEHAAQYFLPVFSEQKYWSDVSNGMRLIIVRELTTHITFYDTVLYLQLDEKELEDFFNLCRGEIQTREMEDVRAKRTMERQMAMFDDGDWDVNEWGRIFDEEVARMGNVGMPSTFLISKKEVEVAKNFLRNYRFREEFPETTPDNFDEVNHIPSFAICSTVMDSLDDYIGAAATFKELDFGQDFLEYLPEDIIVTEKVLEGEGLQIEIEIVDDPPIASVEKDHAPSQASHTTSTHQPKEKSTQKDSLTGMDVIPLDLIKKPKRGRPPKKDNILKAAPTRLREVMNAGDVATPLQSPSSTPGPTPASDTTVDMTGSTPLRFATPIRSTSAARSVQAVARNPFKDHWPSTPPPKHSASFRDDLPAQPAPSSPPKASGFSRPGNGRDAANSVIFQPVFVQPTLVPPIGVQREVQSRVVLPAGVSQADSQSSQIGTTKATTPQDHYVSPTNTLAVPVSSMSMAPSTIPAAPVHAQPLKQRKKSNARPPSATQKPQSTANQSAQTSLPGLSSGAFVAQKIAQSALGRKLVSPPSASKAASATTSNGPDPALGVQKLGRLVAQAESLLEQATLASISNSDGIPSMIQSSMSVMSAPPSSSTQGTEQTSTLKLGTFSSDGSRPVGQESVQGPQLSRKTTHHPPNSSIHTPQTVTRMAPQKTFHPPPQSSSAASIPDTRPVAIPATVQQGLAPSAPQITHPVLPQVVPSISIPKSQTGAVSVTRPQTQLPDQDVSQTSQLLPSLASSYKSEAPSADAGASSLSKPAPEHVVSVANDGTPAPFWTYLQSEFPVNTPLASITEAGPKKVPIGALIPPLVKGAQKIPSASVATVSSSKPVSSNLHPNAAIPSPATAARKKHHTLESSFVSNPTISPGNTSAPRPKSTPKKKPAPASVPPQSKSPGTPGKLKLKFNTRGPQASPPPGRAHNATYTPSEVSPGKRPRDDEEDTPQPEKKLAKKPRLEQPDPPKNSFMAKVKGGMRAMSSMLTGSKDAAEPTNLAKVPDIINKSDKGIVKDPDIFNVAGRANQPAVVVSSEEHIRTQNRAVTPDTVDAAETYYTPQRIPMTHNVPAPSMDNHSESVNPTQQLRMAGNTPISSPLGSTDIKSTKIPKTPTKALASVPNQPNRPRKSTGFKEETAKDTSQALLEEVAAQTAEAIDESKVLGALPPILAEKTRSAARHARTNSQSSTECGDGNRTNRAMTSTPGLSLTPNPALLQETDTDAAKAASKVLGAPLSFLADKTRSARMNSESSTEGVGNKRVTTSVSESSMTGPPKQSRRSTTGVQIPAPKRAASEVLAPSFEREGSPKKKLKTGEASSLADSPAKTANPRKTGYRRGPYSKTMKKLADELAATQPNSFLQTSISTSSAEPASMLAPTPQMNSGPAKKGGDAKKATAPAKVAPAVKATPQPKVPTKSKTAAPKAAPQPRATKATVAKPKATTKSKQRGSKLAGIKKTVAGDDAGDGDDE